MLGSLRVPFSLGGESGQGEVEARQEKMSQGFLETLATRDRTYCSIDHGLHKKLLYFSLYLRPKGKGTIPTPMTRQQQFSQVTN